jgi:hypothetical protein
MATSTPVRDGFRAVLAAPAVVLAEIAWRWAFGAVVWVALVVAAVEWMSSISVSDRDLIFLRSMAPPLVAEALRNIFAGSGIRLVRMLLVLGPALALFWVAAAAVGRGAILARLLGSDFDPACCRGALLRLGLLRVTLGLAAVIGFFGVALLVGSRPWPPAIAALLLLVLWTAIAVFFSTLNWLLWVAAIFAVRDVVDALDAIAASGRFLAQRTGAIAVCNLSFGLMRLAGLILALTLSLSLAAAVWNLSVAAAYIAMLVVALAFCAFADFLFMARVSAYIALAEEPQPPLVEQMPSSGAPELPPSLVPQQWS